MVDFFSTVAIFSDMLFLGMAATVIESFPIYSYCQIIASILDFWYHLGGETKEIVIIQHLSRAFAVAATILPIQDYFAASRNRNAYVLVMALVLASGIDLFLTGGPPMSFEDFMTNPNRYDTPNFWPSHLQAHFIFTISNALTAKWYLEMAAKKDYLTQKKENKSSAFELQSNAISSTSRWSAFYYSVAIFNVLVTLPSFVLSDEVILALSKMYFDPEAHEELVSASRNTIFRLYRDMMMGLILCFGVAYVLIGMNPNGERGLKAAMALGKTFVALRVFWFAFMTGYATQSFVFVFVCELLQAALCAYHLYSGPNEGVPKKLD